MLTARGSLLRRLLKSQSLRLSFVLRSSAQQWRPCSSLTIGVKTASHRNAQQIARFSVSKTPRQHREEASLDIDDDDAIPFEPYEQKSPPNTTPAVLPVSCPGCGAFSQWVYIDEAGYYTLNRKSVRRYLKYYSPKSDESSSFHDVVRDVQHTSKQLSEETASPHEASSILVDIVQSVLRHSSECHSAKSSYHIQSSMALVDSVQSALRNGTEVQKKAQTKRSSQIQTSGALVSVIQLALRNGTEALARFGRLERVRTVESKASSQSVRLTETPPPDTPLCDRCHNLTKHGVASPIPSPPLSYIRGLLERSPYPYNHVYHVIDAADFPLTVIPNLYRQLNLQEQRSRNRRSKTTTYESGRRKPTVSFIITRSDLLAATEEKVNALMPYITRLLRDRLNIDGEHARMGNVHMVSAHRGWWTRVIKEQVRDHAGGVWMVGKANVGKSSLLSVIFPKLHAAAKESSSPKAKDEIVLPLLAQYNPHELLPDSLLPPPQPVMKYPIFPIVSSTPGTTASPVRIPLTHKRGEIIDLPGLARRGLDEYVEENHIKDLVMKSRIKAERSAIKPGQSMLLGGLIRITPLDPDVTILAAPFVNLPWHIAASEKTTSLQRQERIVPETIIAKKGIQDCFASAGVFELDDDVTRYYGQWKKYGQSLPYRVLGKDILIQGCGWVELNIQVRRKQLEAGFIPKVEVFSPEGDFVGSRPSMCAYANELEKLQKTQRRNRSRPRQSMRRVRLTSRGPFNR